jgi:anti-sigma factor RsiW
MGSILEQLDQESVVLMYVAGELPAEDAAEVVRRLAADPKLAEELERVTASLAFCEGALSADDEATRLPMSAETAVRRMSRAMKQWQVDRLTKKTMQPGSRQPFRLPVWSYPVGVAVAVIVAMLIWARALPDAGQNQLTPEQLAQIHQKTAEQFQQDWESSFSQEIEAQDLLASRELPNDPEDFANDVFLRSGG